MGDPAATATTTTDPSSTTTEPAKPAPAAFTAEQQAEINRLIGDARKEGRDAEAKRRDDAAAAAEAKRQQDEATKRGEFDSVKASLEAERDAHKATAETLQAELDKWRELATKELDAAIKDLKAKAPKLAALDPGGDDLFARREWVAKAIDAAGELVTDPKAGNGANPPSNGKPPSAQQTVDEMRRLRGLPVRR